jgi:hypothetical protein
MARYLATLARCEMAQAWQIYSRWQIAALCSQWRSDFFLRQA